MKQKRYCSVADCNNPYYSKGFCRLHYVRQRRGISFDLPHRRTGAGLRLLTSIINDANQSKLDSEECILWGHAVNKDGYGKIKVDGIWFCAHRYVLEETLKVHPDIKYQAKNLCGFRHCVNPYHWKPQYMTPFGFTNDYSDALLCYGGELDG